jgi:hypothetical protein
MINEASNKTSKVPKILKKAKFSDVMKAVLKSLADNDEYAEELAKGLLAAKTGKEVSGAFGKIKELIDAEGVDSSDAEALLNIKLANMMQGFIENAGFDISEIKTAFDEAAAAATSKD